MTTTTGLKPLSRLIPLLSQVYTPSEKLIPLKELDQEILNMNFSSLSRNLLPREDEHIRRQPAFLALLKYYLTKNSASNEHLFHSLKTPDKEIPENNEFIYPMIKPMVPGKCSGVIFLLHGLNERSWEKYLPWASRLAESTGKAVILFPIAFHMNRAPAVWSQLRPMMGVSRERKTLLPDLEGSSFANAAISYRMQFAPQRFILSGVQTFGDVIQVIKSIRKGEHKGLRSDATVDFFAFSIGATLAEVLLMANPSGLLSHTRAFLFCGGPALNLCTPINRGIIDNHGFNVIVGFFHELVDGRVPELEKLETVLDDSSLKYFKSLLISEKLRSSRESRLNEIQDRLRVLTLAKDQVMPPEAVRRTLAGDQSLDPVFCETLDFPYPYAHENPFGIGKKINTQTDPEEGRTDSPDSSALTDAAFDLVFSRAAEFLS